VLRHFVRARLAPVGSVLRQGVRSLYLEHVAGADHAPEGFIPSGALAILEHGAVNVGQGDRALRMHELLVDALDLHAAHFAVVARHHVLEDRAPVHTFERVTVWLAGVAAGLL